MRNLNYTERKTTSKIGKKNTQNTNSGTNNVTYVKLYT